MAKRKLPPHIVLPNGQWRFVKRGSSHSRTTTRKTRSAAGGSMARRGFRRRRGGSKSGWGAVVKPFIFGGIVGFAQAKIAPQVIPAQGAVLGGATAYMTGSRQLPAVGAGVLGGLLGSKVGGGQPTSIGGIAFY